MCNLFSGWLGSSALVLSWLACRNKWFLMGSTRVSWCRWLMFVSAVHPVAILSAVFCIICSFCRFVFDAIGDQMVLPYSSVGRVIVLYVVKRVSLFLPHLVAVRALVRLRDFFALSFVILMCSAKFSLGSNVMPSIFGFLVVGMVILLIVRFSVVLYSAGSGVNRVEEYLSDHIYSQ